MQAYVSIEAPRSGRLTGIIRESYERAWNRVAGMTFQRIDEAPSAVPVDRPDLVAKVRAIFDEEFPESLKPLYEVLIIPRPTLSELKRSEFVVFGLLGDNATGLDTADSAERDGSGTCLYTCFSCGNSRPALPPPLSVRGKRLPVSKQFFSFSAKLSLFCRPSFAELFGQAGLTGLEFEKITSKLTGGAKLLMVRPAQHDWGAGPSVCAECGMKTNVRYLEFFNQTEHYRYDIQYVVVFGGIFFVLSQSAVEFLNRTSHSKIEDAEVPVAPGLLKDWIAPPDCFFGHGAYPTRLLSY